MWALNESEILGLQGLGGGQPFTEFVDALIGTAAWHGGVPSAELRTNFRVHIADKGVDTALACAVPRDASGWLSVPTVWQYKAEAYTEVRRRKQLTGDYVHQLVREGHAYRLAIADSVPAVTVADWNAELLALARAVSPAALPPGVVTAGSLKDWANHYPALVLRRFRPNLAATAQHFDAWRAGVTAHSKEYVPVAHWVGLQEVLRRHMDLQLPVPEVVLPLQGEPGVGKTRVVFEAAQALGLGSVVAMYMPDEARATEIAT